MDTIQRELREFAGVSAIIYDQTCATEKRRRRKRGQFPDPARRVFINDAVCEGCGDCSSKSNCMSVTNVATEFGNKRKIDQSSCNKDFTCLDGFCPSFVTVEGGKLRKPAAMQDSMEDVWLLPEPEVACSQTPYGILITGVGGTGVVTIGALLGMAAFIEGKGVLSLDMAGMAQKGGAVWSHIRIAADQADLNAPRIAEGEANFLLGCDLVVSANSETLVKVRQDITHALVNLEESITSAFVRTYAGQAETGDLQRHPEPDFCADQLKEQISEAVGHQNADFIGASQLATALMGDSIATNMFMLGYACQRGWLPVSHESLMQAVALNGTAIAANKAAFLWGRRAAVDLKKVEARIGQKQSSGSDRTETLDDLVARRVTFLTQYHDARFAERYHHRVLQFRHIEQELFGAPGKLTEAVARNYFKVLAIKDEYEVARLYARPEFLSKVATEFEGDFKLRFHLAPPLFSGGKKSAYGPWVLGAFKLLAQARRIRNTWLDPFARTHERKAELAWLREYETVLEALAKEFTANRHKLAIELAELPDAVRGYGPVKDRYLLSARERMEALLTRWRAPEFSNATQQSKIAVKLI
ncbi:hypothetical protein B8W72_29975 [Pseudomonas putida]|uniref:Uncharacterized protein n=1 Tax=Pseudomonas putida TaxID=303 RepID=A0A1Y3KAW2_PSEPU|nr:DUF6537 domain-containing protein [Pseudomonas putida]OUM22978.1 hypothetical protein B8W72_29975 [Pseudomonas putida]